MMLRDERIDECTVRCQGCKSRLFVLPHQAAVAGNVGTQNCGEIAFHSSRSDLAICHLTPASRSELRPDACDTVQYVQPKEHSAFCSGLDPVMGCVRLHSVLMNL
jgi:hypothetical protein